MTPSDLVALFGPERGAQSRAADELTKRGLPTTRAAVSVWIKSGAIPLRTQFAIQSVMRGKVKADKPEQ